MTKKKECAEKQSCSCFLLCTVCENSISLTEHSSTDGVWRLSRRRTEQERTCSHLFSRDTGLTSDPRLQLPPGTKSLLWSGRKHLNLSSFLDFLGSWMWCDVLLTNQRWLQLIFGFDPTTLFFCCFWSVFFYNQFMSSCWLVRNILIIVVQQHLKTDTYSATVSRDDCWSFSFVFIIWWCDFYYLYFVGWFTNIL